MLKTLLPLICIFFTNIYSQTDLQDSFNEQAFFENLKSSYYSLESTHTKNISFFVTNLTVESFCSKEWKNPEIFPLQLIWLSPNRLFISQQGVPALSDSSKIVYSKLVNDLKNQIMNMLFSLKTFYFADIYNSIPENYQLNKKENLIQIKFSSTVQEDSTLYEYYFGLNGLCVKIISLTPAKNLKVEIYPNFKISKTKWIIEGWQVKIYNNNEIQTGYVVEMNYREKSGIWIPTDIVINVQRKEEEGKTFSEDLKFRNALFNQPMQYLEKAQ